MWRDLGYSKFRGNYDEMKVLTCIMKLFINFCVTKYLKASGITVNFLTPNNNFQICFRVMLQADCGIAHLITVRLGNESISRFNLAKKQTTSAQTDSYKTCWFNGSDYALSTYILLLSLRQSCIDERFQKTQNHSENLLTVIVYIETGRNKYSNNGSLPRLNIRCV